MNFFDQNNIKIDKKSYKSTLIYYTGYVMIKDSKYVKINSVNLLHLIFNKVNEYFEEIDENKYLTLQTLQIIHKLSKVNVCISYRREGNKKSLYFTRVFINYKCIINSCYLIKYKLKKKLLSPVHVTNNKLK